MDWADPPSFPSLIIPDAPVMPPTVFEVPRGSLPSYKPLVAPPNTLRPPPGIKPIELKDEPPSSKPKSTKPPTPPEAQIVEIPFTDVEVPMPSTTIMTTAATTAFISVAATLTATSLFKWLVKVFKPLFKQIWTKLTKKKNQKAS
jgi:hypothetical protein|tara:strand:- start:1780 stop:2214 length:435 start_codon:yes stop_codon:yes gene_type:complete